MEAPKDNRLSVDDEVHILDLPKSSSPRIQLLARYHLIKAVDHSNEVINEIHDGIYRPIVSNADRPVSIVPVYGYKGVYCFAYTIGLWAFKKHPELLVRSL